jgi:hypothetical protein
MQYVPGFSVVVSWAIVPAIAADVEFVMAQLLLFGVPIPRPTALDDDGVRAVSVTATLPAAATVNVNATELLWASAPENVSVVAVVDGDVLLKRLHPAASTVATANANDTKRRLGALTSALASERAETRYYRGLTSCTA